MVLRWLIVSDSFARYTMSPGILSCSWHCHFLLTLCLVVMTGFKVGGGEAVLVQDQPGTSREGTLHELLFTFIAPLYWQHRYCIKILNHVRLNANKNLVLFLNAFADKVA